MRERKLKKSGKLRALSGARVDVDTFAVKISSLTVVVVEALAGKGFDARAFIKQSRREHLSQAAVRQLHFNEWHLTEVWQRALDR